METLTLNQRTYLMECIQKVVPDESNLWDITEVITPAQRGKMLALYYRHDYGQIKDMFDSIKNLQYLPKAEV